MGWNTGVIILNDALHEIEKNPDEFVNGRRGLREAMGEFMSGGRGQRNYVDISVGGHANAASVFHQSHADEVGVYSIGGNCAKKIGKVYNGGRHCSEDDQLALLHVIADNMGYKLVKKKKRE